MDAQILFFVVAVATGMVNSQANKCDTDIDWILGQVSGDNVERGWIHIEAVCLNDDRKKLCCLGCGGRITVTSSTVGWIRPPPAVSAYGGSDNYESNLVCVWALIAPEGTQLRLTHDPAFSFEIAESCLNDKLVIAGTEYCRDHPFTSTTIASNKAVATFLSDRSIGGRGFNIKIEAIGTPTGNSNFGSSDGNKLNSLGFVLLSAICALVFWMV